MIKYEHITMKESAENWMEAVRIAAEPLLEEGIITDHYVEKMIDTVHELGAYIVISKDVAIPHARPEDGARSTALALLKLKNRVAFTPDKEVNTVIVLASSNSDNHIQLLKNLSILLSEKEKYQALINSHDKDEIYDILNGKEVE